MSQIADGAIANHELHSIRGSKGGDGGGPLIGHNNERSKLLVKLLVLGSWIASRE